MKLIKTFGSKSISSLLYFLSGIGTFIFGAIFLFISTSVLLGNMTVNAENQFSIRIPLTDSFFKGINATNTFAAILGFMLFYGLFFLILTFLFKVFKQRMIFSDVAIKRLRWFAILNILFPPLYVILGYWETDSIQLADVMPPVLHNIIGIFSLFLMAIFKQGFEIQNENDLTI